MKKKIAVFTSGGDSPGMNACIKGILDYASKFNIEVIGIKSGFRGLIERDFVKLTPEMAKEVMHKAGTFIKTSRYPEFKNPEITKKGADIIKREGFECVIGIGGDGTYRGLEALKKLGTNIIGLPGTIDNDIPYCDETIGFDTAYNAAAGYIKAAAESMESLDRAFVAEVMGRTSGNIALYAGIAGGADIIIVPEHPTTVNEICAKVLKLKESGNMSPTIVVYDGYEHYDELITKIKEVCGIETRGEIIGFIQRGAEPTAHDVLTSYNLGMRVVELYNQKKFGVAVGMRGNKLFDCPIEEVQNFPSNFDSELYRKFSL